MGRGSGMTKTFRYCLVLFVALAQLAAAHKKPCGSFLKEDLVGQEQEFAQKMQNQMQHFLQLSAVSLGYIFIGKHKYSFFLDKAANGAILGGRVVAQVRAVAHRGRPYENIPQTFATFPEALAFGIERDPVVWRAVQAFDSNLKPIGAMNEVGE